MGSQVSVKIVAAFFVGVMLTAAMMWIAIGQRGYSYEQQKTFVTFVLQNSAEWRRNHPQGVVPRENIERSAVLSIDDPEFRPDLLHVSPSGDLIAFKQSSGVLLIVRPETTDGTITWRCSGFPSAAMPTSCR